MPKPIKLLIAEDNPNDAEVLLQALHQAGYEPQWKRVDQEADFVAALREGPDLVLSDYSMPQFSGPRALELVRTLHPEIPFIIVSGTIGEEMAVESMRLGATDYLLKDRLGRLGPAVSRALEMGRLWREARRNERALKNSEESLARAQHIAQIGSWDLELANLEDINANLLRWSDELFRIFGHEPGQIEVTNDNFFRRVHPDDRGKIRAAVAETLRSGHTYSIDHRIILPGGTERVVHEQANLVRDDQGRPLRMVGTTQDVTARKQAEESVRVSEARYHTLFDYAPDGIVIADAESHYLDANASACRLFGYRREEFIGLHASDIVVAAEVPHITPALEAIKAGSDYHHEWLFRRKDGSTFSAEVMATRMPDGNLLGMIRDITERRQADEKIRESEERFRRLIENASDMIAVIDAAGVIRYQSPSTPRLLGYAADEMMGRKAGEFIHPDDHAKVGESIRRALAGEERPIPVEFRIRHRDGRWRIFQSFGKRMAGVADEVQVVVNSRDITESRLLEEQLRQSQKMEAIGQLSGGVAHDFNNLLAVIMGYVGLLQAKGQVSPEIAGSIHHIGEAADRAANLVRQLLTFSRKQVMQLSDHNLNGLVINLTKMLRRLLSENIEMQVECATAPLAIRADEGMVEQVLLNLVINARDAMPQGGVLRITTKAVDLDEAAAGAIMSAHSGSFACLIVSDTGTGIAPEIVPRIFEPFFTTKGEGKGTGLGLATVYGVMQQHSGWISVESEVGRGTTFLAYFPRLAAAEFVNRPDKLGAAVRGGHEGILLVEDDSGVRKFAEVALTGLGYRVFSAYNGSDALQVWQAQKQLIELLLTDMVLPDRMTGRELALRLRSDNPRLPIIYMSGYKTENAGGAFQLREDTNYLAKPFDVVGLAKIVRASLDRGATQAPFARPPA